MYPKPKLILVQLVYFLTKVPSTVCLVHADGDMVMRHMDMRSRALTAQCARSAVYYMQTSTRQATVSVETVRARAKRYALCSRGERDVQMLRLRYTSVYAVASTAAATMLDKTISVPRLP